MNDPTGEDGLTLWRSGKVIGSNVEAITPATPAIILIDPKFPHNVGQIVRLASCFGIKQVWMTGRRVELTAAKRTGRIPREERMRGYQDVTLVRADDALDRILAAVPTAVPVAIELRPGSEALPDFVHPHTPIDIGRSVPAPSGRAPIYIFGPEDSSIPGAVLKRCHRFVTIPSFQCLNLATSVACVLYDAMVKSGHRPQVRGRGKEELCHAE
jgi:tRNA(Leu) C34 or U34 (ribose-2'-O)-methylase TrmL